MKENLFDLLYLWLRNYFHHPVENIRQAKPIVSRRLYSNFGNICKAVPYKPHEEAFVSQDSITFGTCPESPDTLLELVRSMNGNRNAVKAMEREIAQAELPKRCILCDFHRYGIPCPIYNELADGSTVCDTHRYKIIKRAPQV